jgi:hypothetical protein
MGNKNLPKPYDPYAKPPMTLGEAWEDFFAKVLYPFRVGGTLDTIGNIMLDIGMGALQSYYQDQAEKKRENFLKCRMCGITENPAIEYDHDMLCSSCLQKIRTLPGVTGARRSSSNSKE